VNFVFCGYILFSILFVSQVWGEGIPPQEVVLKYYHALQNKDFPRAYQNISPKMRAGKNQAEWVKDIQEIFIKGKVEISKISVSEVQISGQEAQVNSTITSKDLVNINGLIEYNLDHLVLEDGNWKLDYTELMDSKILGCNSKERE
jgi:hypothetical protein